MRAIESRATVFSDAKSDFMTLFPQLLTIHDTQTGRTSSLEELAVCRGLTTASTSGSVNRPSLVPPSPGTDNQRCYQEK
jgi:hypothetical protein